MTLQDMAAIQRNLGIIEGAMLAAPKEAQTLINGAVVAIDEILAEEEIVDGG